MQVDFYTISTRIHEIFEICQSSDNVIKTTSKPVTVRYQQGINSDYQNNTKRYFQILPPQPLKPHRSDAVLFYADIKTLKGYKAAVGILSKTKHRAFSHRAKGPVILLFLCLFAERNLTHSVSLHNSVIQLNGLYIAGEVVDSFAGDTSVL